jgi:hypothetical protein
MTRPSVMIATAILLVLLVGTQLTVPRVTAAAVTTNQSGWWNSAYEFRRPVTVTNGGTNPFVNQTVLLHLNFTGNDVEDPFVGVRLIDSSGAEVSSVILGPQFSGPFLRSAYLLFLTNMAPQSSAVYYIYYGAAFQKAPSYRGSAPTNSIGSGFVTATMEPLSLDSTRIRLTFGTIDSETTMSGVSYVSEGVTRDYGPTDFSQRPLSNDTGMILAGELNAQTPVAYDVLQAGSVQLTRIIVLSPKSVLTIDAVATSMSTAASKITLTSVIGLDGLSSLGSSSSAYNEQTGLLYTQNPDAYFGMQQSSSAASFTLGKTSAVLGEASTGQFSNVASFSLASAAGFIWNLGDLQPDSAVWLSSAWSVAVDTAHLGSNLIALPTGATLGHEEIHSTATPKARSLWTTAVTLTNLVIPPSGALLPFEIKGGELVSASSVSGTYSYTVPPPPQPDSNVWKVSSSSTGNATSYASPQYYAFDIGRNVERLSGTVPNTVDTATASLISTPGLAFGGSNAVLQVEYKASYIVTAGSLSAQDLFVSADLDPKLSGNFSQSIFVPVSGSSTTIPVSGCAPSGSKDLQLHQVAPAAVLVGDNKWRTLSVALPASLPASGFNVILRTCLSTSPGFSGELDLAVAAAGVVLNGPATNVIQSTISHDVPELTLRYLPQALSVASVGTTANLTVSLEIQSNSSIGWQDGSTFSGVVTAPKSFGLNASNFGRVVTVGQLSFAGVLISSSVAQFVNAGQIGGVSAMAFPGPGIALVEVSNPTNVGSGSAYTIGLRSQPVYVAVLDQNQAGVSNVQVVPSVDGKGLPISTLTNGSGVAKLQLVPWTFQLNATYQATNVGTAVIQGGASSVSIVSDLYSLTLIVKDTRGGVLAGAQLALSNGNYNFSGTTDSLGRYSFEGIANAVYSLIVSVGSSPYFTGHIGATANNAVIQVTTTYLPAYWQLLIAVLVAMIPVAVVTAYFVTRRFRRAT